MNTFDLNSRVPVLSSLPPEARAWLTDLPWQERRYVLSLCHLVCATPSAQQAEFLDVYTAEGLLSRIVHDADTRERVNEHLAHFHSQADIDDITVRRYIRQVYMHSVKDARSHPDLYLETALSLMGSAHEHSSILSYILGFEILKLLFAMSWEQHERLYHLQPNQDDFTREYIRPVQEAHKRHGIVVPKDEKTFFARRDYFIRRPNIHPHRMVNLIIEAFTADKIIDLGFAVLRHPNAIHYDHDYIHSNLESPPEISPESPPENPPEISLETSPETLPVTHSPASSVKNPLLSSSQLADHNDAYLSEPVEELDEFSALFAARDNGK